MIDGIKSNEPLEPPKLTLEVEDGQIKIDMDDPEDASGSLARQVVQASTISVEGLDLLFDTNPGGLPGLSNWSAPIDGEIFHSIGLEGLGAIRDYILESRKGTLSPADACKLLHEVQSMHWNYDKNRGPQRRACQVRTLDNVLQGDMKLLDAVASGFDRFDWNFRMQPCSAEQNAITQVRAALPRLRAEVQAHRQDRYWVARYLNCGPMKETTKAEKPNPSAAAAGVDKPARADAAACSDAARTFANTIVRARDVDRLRKATAACKGKPAGSDDLYRICTCREYQGHGCPDPGYTSFSCVNGFGSQEITEEIEGRFKAYQEQCQQHGGIYCEAAHIAVVGPYKHGEPLPPSP